MPNYHATSEGNVPFTAEEEIAWAAEQAAWAAGESDRKAAEVRAERNAKLALTDWTQTVDAPQATKDKYATYRQTLRDVPAQNGFPNTVVWPDAP
tara:strand:+ start:902 stop:1186 length:285 start_codon:yes stop_codon:yes gene_type:complete